MRKSLLLSLGVVLLFFACTKFEIVTEINPTISVIDRNIGLVYQLGNLKISHMLERVDRDIVDFIKENKDEDDTVYMLRVKYTNEGGSDLYGFTYYINGIEIKGKRVSPPVTKDMLLANMDKVPGFQLYELEGKSATEENKEEIEKKIKKVQEKVKEENKDIYAPSENKWE